MWGAWVRVIHSEKQALDTVMLEMGQRVAEDVMRTEGKWTVAAWAWER